MQVDIFTICDSSQVYEGKMVIMGAFSSVVVNKLPYIVQSLSLAIRLTYIQGETGIKDYSIDVICPSGKKLIGTLNCKAEVKAKENNQSVSNVNFNLVMNNVIFSESGIYKAIMKTEGQTYTCKFAVIKSVKESPSK